MLPPNGYQSLTAFLLKLFSWHPLQITVNELHFTFVAEKRRLEDAGSLKFKELIDDTKDNDVKDYFDHHSLVNEQIHVKSGEFIPIDEETG